MVAACLARAGGPLDLKRRLIAQIVESSRLLRNYIDHRAKGRGTTRAQWMCDANATHAVVSGTDVGHIARDLGGDIGSA